ncbi:TPA: hypothetical protein DEQ22_01075 [Candidatus Nomurabacteria bacterium]|uniref:Serine protease n=2 Tax=Candidatus Nomuraibacteriota TaxID=1752729 RepID=A0A1F6YN78_9BACT|nr:MAG: hypothetical protein UV13_C0007G0051 [Parcubacteria group bacterium GW2011_GWC1_42_21]KKS58773.1 MAG: hypothetical protein UV23_C0001G0040 [Candidatus Nomurabacteria bacterium GW2011_GWF1_42_40]KKT00097.1 MAG: hypothetical protein UV77_C0007G0051 [Candidatus Nomurabacteria bacterium GW2011_GWA1_43_17]KKT08032.1 MAG: hypothetical protein UV85_C0002G0051 [Candidatus Nomurabacteria bacterium GW2011_GWB1_43_19]KKT11582.1 MAG: hypothetical protein UV91_C0004G0051 [Candidatus Nomurabacteria b
MALIPPHYLNSVVSIEVERKNDKGELEKVSIATGFLVGKKTGKANEKGSPLFKVFLVTNRHVFYNEKTKIFLKEVHFRFNTTENTSQYFKTGLLKIDGTPLWLQHENKKVDLAVLPINLKVIKDAKVEYHFFNTTDLFFAKDFKEKKISTGDGLFVLGFPMNISGKSKNFVIVRQGIIARVDEEVLEDCFYYIDASAYPGNSGGPVIHKPEVVAIGETGSNSSAGLVGVVSAGVTYSDVAVSQQTGEAKIIFTEQTGLVKVVPIELIYEIIDKFMTPKTLPEEAKVENAGKEKAA